jgi:hypothetical protein
VRAVVGTCSEPLCRPAHSTQPPEVHQRLSCVHQSLEYGNSSGECAVLVRLRGIVFHCNPEAQNGGLHKLRRTSP